MDDIYGVPLQDGPTPNKFNQRRARRYSVSLQCLIHIFNGRVKIVGEGLPPDAEIGHVNADYSRNALSIFVYSYTYPPVPEGVDIPSGDGDGCLLVLRHYPEEAE